MYAKEKAALNQLSEVSLTSSQRVHIFRSLNHKEQAHILKYLQTSLKKTLLGGLKNDELILPLEHMDPDEATDIIQMLSPTRQQKVLNELSKQLKEGIQILAEFDPETAAGLMNLDYIQIAHSLGLFINLKNMNPGGADRLRLS